jgi:hypothetical protein
MYAPNKALLYDIDVAVKNQDIFWGYCVRFLDSDAGHPGVTINFRGAFETQKRAVGRGGGYKIF